MSRTGPFKTATPAEIVPAVLQPFQAVQQDVRGVLAPHVPDNSAHMVYLPAGAPADIKTFISRTAVVNPVNTARATMENPMFNSRIPSIRDTGPTLS